MHYKNIFWDSDRELCRKLGKHPKYVYYYLKKGKTYMEIIDNALRYKFYRGIKWKTNNELSIKLGKGRNYVHMHKKQGMTYKQIIDQVLDQKKGT